MAFKDKEQITIFLTSNCNLKCYYCYMPKTYIESIDRYIDLNFAKKGIEDFFNSSNSRLIRFFGSGEPTMAFDLIKEIYEYAYSLVGEQLEIELETNGFFNKSILKWVELNVDYLWFSFDGPPEIQDKQRPTINEQGSSSLILENIKYLVSSCKKQFGVRATISQANINKQVELIEYFNSLGVKYVSASPIYFSKVNPEINTPSLLEFAQNFVPAYFRALELNMFYQTLLIANFEEKTDIYCQTSIPTPRLTTDGFVSSCDWASMGNKYLPHSIKQELIYGEYDKLNNSINYFGNKIEKIRRRNVDYLKENFCKNCEAVDYCAGGCVGKMAAITNDLYSASDEWCAAIKYLFSRIPRDVKYPCLHP